MSGVRVAILVALLVCGSYGYVEGRISIVAINSHKDLIVWQKSMDLAVDVYALTATFPSTETYRITSQLTRSAV